MEFNDHNNHIVVMIPYIYLPPKASRILCHAAENILGDYDYIYV